MKEDPAPDYCPFCGARLPDDSGALRTHLGNHEDCRERYEAWGDGWFEAAAVGNDPRARRNRRLRTVLLVVIVGLVMGYSLLVVQQILLGVIASGIVVLAFWLVGSRNRLA